MNFMSRIIIDWIKLIKDICLYQLKSETKKETTKTKKNIFLYILKPTTKKKKRNK